MIEIPGKIPIYIHPFFWMLAFFIGALAASSDPSVPTFLGSVVWVLVIMLSLLVHEFGHALTALGFGHVAQIHLLAFGGLTVREGRRLSAWKEFLVVLNGPLFGITAFALAWMVRPLFGELPPLSAMALGAFIRINLYWSILNLLPVIPLDGGRLVSVLLEGIFGLKGLRVSYFMSMLMAVSLAALFFFSGSTLMGALILLFAFESFREYQASRQLSMADQDEELASAYRNATSLLQEGKVAEGLDLLSKIRSKAEGGVLYVEATIQMAAVLARGGEVEEPYHLLLPIKDKLSMESLQLFQELAFRMADWKTSVEVGQVFYAAAPNARTAFLIALCHGRLNQVDAAVGWLRTSRRDGLENPVEALSRREFDEIRQTPSFVALSHEWQQ